KTERQLQPLGQVVHGVWQFEGPLGVAAGEVALLIAETEKNRISLLREFASFRPLEVACARKCSAVRFQNETGPLIPLISEIPLRRVAQVGRPPGDENPRDVQFSRPSRERQCRSQRLRLTERLPRSQPAGPLLQVARATRNACPTIEPIGGPIRERRLID